MTTAAETPAVRKIPTPAHRRALLAALANNKGRVPEGTNGRVLDAIHGARWVTEVTNNDRAAWGARLLGYDGPTFLVINSRGRRALLTEAEDAALRGAGPDGCLPEGTLRPTVKALHRDGLVEIRRAARAPYVTELGRRLITGFPQAHRTA
ncbi:hypothetical protein OG413_20610 [Streptomyces sp. NBC_01433]|uniref:hypothetical protein n=1 Tax=Streptomyces sp. NBC_01433 TaxID=2903864 RepID=UPI0022502D3B|nr:hypothetical protein [Streptomyces sp. NBC_01433]MCX4677677.1 hypothetical protein [Streptomyces sp. NBC_01433]